MVNQLDELKREARATSFKIIALLTAAVSAITILVYLIILDL